MQSKVLKDIMKVVTAAGFEAIDCPHWPNIGRISIQHYDEVGELGSVYYNFQRDTMTFEITLDGERLLSQPPRREYYSFYMKYTLIDEYRKFRARLENELRVYANNLKVEAL